MDDRRTTVGELKRLVLEFSQARDWEQFHHPKDLGLALAIEVGELLEYFRYRMNEEIAAALAEPRELRGLAHELADCLWLVLRLADVCGIDAAGALEEKVALAALKYPIEKVKGLPHKYTRYERDDPPGTRARGSEP